MAAIRNLMTELRDLGDEEGLLNFEPTQYTHKFKTVKYITNTT